jgi:hypothetical protein
MVTTGHGLIYRLYVATDLWGVRYGPAIEYDRQLSTTRTEKVKVPDTDGVPLMAPLEDKLRPVGNVPVTEYESAPIPPVATIL